MTCATCKGSLTSVQQYNYFNVLIYKTYSGQNNEYHNCTCWGLILFPCTGIRIPIKCKTIQIVWMPQIWFLDHKVYLQFLRLFVLESTFFTMPNDCHKLGMHTERYVQCHFQNLLYFNLMATVWCVILLSYLVLYCMYYIKMPNQH